MIEIKGDEEIADPGEGTIACQGVHGNRIRGAWSSALLGDPLFRSNELEYAQNGH